MFNDDITGPEGTEITVFTAVNGSFDEHFGNFTLKYGAENATWPLAFNATADDVEEALEVRATLDSTTRCIVSVLRVIVHGLDGFALSLRAGDLPFDSAPTMGTFDNRLQGKGGERP